MPGPTRERAPRVALAARLQNWKELVIPELLERVTKYNIKRARTPPARSSCGWPRTRRGRRRAIAAAAEAGERRAAS